MASTAWHSCLFSGMCMALLKQMIFSCEMFKDSNSVFVFLHLSDDLWDENEQPYI